MSSGVLRFDDNVNDLDFFTKFKYTTKGPNSLGGKNSNNISIRYRGLHPSFLGNIDLLVCGNSDPGTSGILSPFGKIDGLYFNDSREPDDFEFNFKESLSKIMEDEDVEYIKVDLDNKEDYYKLLDELSQFNKTAITISGKPKESYTIIMENINSSDDIDEEIEEGVENEE